MVYYLIFTTGRLQLLTTYQKNNFTNTNNQLYKPIHFNDLLKCEEDYFIYALDKVNIMLKCTKKYYQEFDDIINKINTHIGSRIITDMRDMRFHSNEFLNHEKIKGRNKKRYISKPSFRGWRLNAAATLICEEGYLIGGRLNVQQSINLLEELLPSVKTLCDIKTQNLYEAQSRLMNE